MSGILVAMQGAVAQGILWGVMVLGVYITYRLLNIAEVNRPPAPSYNPLIH